MTALIVGGDYIQTLRRELLAHGLTDVEHWDGRQSRITQRNPRQRQTGGDTLRLCQPQRIKCFEAAGE